MTSTSVTTGRSPMALICVTSLDPSSLLEPAPNAAIRFTLPDFISQPPRPQGRARYFSLWYRSKEENLEGVTLLLPKGAKAKSYGFYTFAPEGHDTHSFLLTDPLALRRDCRAPKLPDDSLGKPFLFFYLPISALGMQEGAHHA